MVDGGLTRRPRFDPATGTNHLVTEHVSRFSADQRRGRAGRTRPGVCIRMWSAIDQDLLIDQALPEIVDGDPLVVAAELLRWGDPDALHLPLLDHPDPQRLDVARRTMAWWGLTEIDEGTNAVHLTELGREVVKLPVHPRVGALLATIRRTLPANDPLAATGLRAAAVLDQSSFPTSDDFEAEVQRARNDRDVERSVRRLRDAIDAARLPPPPADQPTPNSLAELLALAWPDRIAVRRTADSHRLLMASGREVGLDRGSSLGRAEAFVIVDTTVVEASGRVRRAVPLERSAITRLHSPAQHVSVEWDRRRNRILAQRQTRHGAIVLHSEAFADPDPADVQRAAEEGVRSNGLDVFRWSERSESVRRRLQWLHRSDGSWPDVSDEALLATLDRWLDLSRIRNVDGLRRLDVGARLLDLLDWDQRRRFDDLAPLELATPSGRTRRIDWSGDRPVWAVRVQDLFGLDVHPTIGPADEPLTIELLSPAGRVAQTTTDLPGFWRGSYAAVRADLRGRYPKHAWPEDPTAGLK